MSKKTSIIVCIVAVVLFLILSNFFYLACVVGSSMEPTLSEDDYLLVSRRSKPDKGDIVIIKQSDKDKYIVKRVIGVSGDKVTFTKNGVSVNGSLLDESYVKYPESSHYYDEYSETVSEDSYFVLGDNRDNSADSRHFGDIRESQVIGVVLFNLGDIGITAYIVQVIVLSGVVGIIAVYLFPILFSFKNKSEV